MIWSVTIPIVPPAVVVTVPVIVKLAAVKSTVPALVTLLDIFELFVKDISTEEVPLMVEELVKSTALMYTSSAESVPFCVISFVEIPPNIKFAPGKEIEPVPE